MLHDRALVYKRRWGTRHGGTLSEPKTETDFQNIANSLAASPSSPDIAEHGQRSQSKGGNTTTCRGMSRGSRVEGRVTIGLTSARVCDTGSPDLCRRPPRW